jgi:hypothetical protein
MASLVKELQQMAILPVGGGAFYTQHPYMKDIKGYFALKKL